MMIYVQRDGLFIHLYVLVFHFCALSVNLGIDNRIVLFIHPFVLVFHIHELIHVHFVLQKMKKGCKGHLKVVTSASDLKKFIDMVCTASIHRV